MSHAGKHDAAQKSRQEKKMEVEEKDNFTPREYQVELFEKSLKRNSIIQLGTGAGKTFIAIMVTKELSWQLKKPYKEGGKRTVFLTKTVPLVHQQAKVFQDHTQLSVGSYVGAMNVDFWTKETWEEQLEKNEILVMTSQILSNILNSGFIRLSSINLLIIDECHHAVGNDPIVEIMKRFMDYPEEDRPRVLGLTASVINKKCSTIAQITKEIDSLKKTLMSAIESASNTTLANRHSTKPIEKLVVCPLNTEFLEEEKKIIELLITAMDYPRNLNFQDSSIEIDEDGYSDLMLPRVKLSYFPKELLHILKNMGLWCTYHLVLIFLKDLNTLSKDMSEEHEQYFQEVRNTLTNIKHDCEKLFEENSDSELERMQKFSKSKICRLLEVLSRKYENGNRNFLRAIIFVEQRTSAWALSKYLQHLRKISDEFNFINADYVVGHGCDPLKINHLQMKAKKQEEVIKKFRVGSYNILIGTRVVEEGMDVPQCNLVVKFDEPKDFRSYVQSKGRARSQNSHYIVLANEEDQDAINRDWILYKQIETEILPSLCRKSEIPSKDDIEDHLLSDLLPPYVPGESQGAIVTMNSAISLVNRYCSKLPRDRFTKLVPKYSFEIGNEAAKTLTCQLDENIEIGDLVEDFDEYFDLGALNPVPNGNNLPLFYCHLKLPVNSAIKETIKGQGMPSMKLAKRAVALKTCELLHRSGELNDHLLPVGKDDLKFLQDLTHVTEDIIPPNTPKAGTTKRRQIYPKKAAEGIGGLPIRSSIPYKLYKISFTFIKEDCPSLQYLKETSNCLGLLCSEDLSHFPSFPIHPKSGVKMLVELSLLPDPFEVDEMELKKIQDFHKHLFTDVLHCVSINMVFDSRLPTCFIIPLVNVCEDEDIYFPDWSLIEEIGNFEEKKCKQTAYNNVGKSLKGAIVKPNYREAHTWFIVHSAVSSKTPLSPFPDPEFRTFSVYFKQHYDVQVKDLKQPLLIVQPLSNHLNMLPVATKRTKKLNKIIEDGKEYFKSIYLVPELCTLFPFSASFLEKSQCIPSILYRCSQMQMVMSLQQEMVSSFSLKIKENASEVCNSNFVAKCQQESLVFEEIWKGSKFSDSEYAIPISAVVQALTTRAANDFINLERLEIIGDSFLKYITTIYLFCKFQEKDEGKLTSGRSKMVSNSHLYHLAKEKELPKFMSAVPFTPVNEWLPPGFYIPQNFETAMKKANVPFYFWKYIENDEGTSMAKSEIWDYIAAKKLDAELNGMKIDDFEITEDPLAHNCTREQKIADKSTADSMEALIGAYLLYKGPEAALQFMMWLGIMILPHTGSIEESSGNNIEEVELSIPKNALVSRTNPKTEIYDSFSTFEAQIDYTFKEKSFLLQAFTHPSYYKNKFTDCYQRLEFLGDAVLDYLITWHLFKDEKKYSPGDLSDLRSALVSNTTFAKLSFKNGFHKYLKYLAPKLLDAIKQYQALLELEEKFSEELYITEEEAPCEEQVEVPKALGDVFESVAGAIFLDSNFSLDAVWKVYFRLMKDTIEEFRDNIPKPPIRQVHEMFPDAIFSQGEELESEDRPRFKVTLTVDNVSVEGFGVNSKVAKLNAAKQFLRKQMRQQQQ